MLDDTFTGEFTFQGISKGEKEYLEVGEVYTLTIEKIPRVTRLSGYVKWNLKYRAIIQLDDEFACAVHYRNMTDFKTDWKQS
jgi:hypothetical protein